jgi:hypothetical protein
MTCAGCGFESPEGMRFRGECGQLLRVASTCPGCGPGGGSSTLP